VSDTFEFIDAEYAASPQNDSIDKPSVGHMCAWLDVSRSGYYNWRTKEESATASRRKEWKGYIHHFFDASDGSYGYRRVHAGLLDHGVSCGPELIRAVMRELGLRPCRPRRWRHSLAEAGDTPHRIPDLVGRDFTADRPGQNSSETLPTFHRGRAGFSWPRSSTATRGKSSAGPWPATTARRSSTTRFAWPPQKSPTRRRRHLPVRPRNDTSADYGKALKNLSIRRSVGRTGVGYDNALAESFFVTLKNERVHRTVYPTRKSARDDIARYIELRYNSRRRHSELGYKTPKQVRNEFENRQLAA
jgi:putative transposase